MIPKIIKTSLLALFVVLLGILVRWVLVENEIRNRPLETSDLSKSGYTPQGVFGHGNVSIKGGELGWYVYDIPAEGGYVKKACANNVLPTAEMDFDFFYYQDKWFKLRSGNLILTEDSMRVEPPFSKWKGAIKAKTAFPVRNPDLPYRLKVIFSKLRHGELSPRQYLEGLKKSNPSCANIPSP